MKSLILLSILASQSVIAAQAVHVYNRSGRHEICFGDEQCVDTDSRLRQKFLKLHPEMNRNSFEIKEGILRLNYRFDSIPLGTVVRVDQGSDYSIVELLHGVEIHVESDDVKKRKERQVNDMGDKYTAHYWDRKMEMTLSVANRTFEIRAEREDFRIDPWNGKRLPLEDFKKHSMQIARSSENGSNEYFGDNKPEHPACTLVREDKKDGTAWYRNGRNVLIEAIEAFDSQNSESKIMQLIDAGADVNYKVPDVCGKYFNVVHEAGVTPLHAAIRTQSKKSAPLIERLLRAGADINARTNSGSHAFFEIKISGHPSDEVEARIMHLFLDHGFDADEKGRFSGDYVPSYVGDSNDPLNGEIHKSEINGIVFAVHRINNTQLLLPLLSRMIEKANINFQLANGITALAFVVGETGEGTLAKTKFFVENGADLQLRDRLGRRACEITPHYNADVKALVCK